MLLAVEVQRAEYTLIKDCTLNHVWASYIILRHIPGLRSIELLGVEVRHRTRMMNLHGTCAGRTRAVRSRGIPSSRKEAS